MATDNIHENVERIIQNKRQKSSPFIIRLQIAEDKQTTYRVSEELFSLIKKVILPFQTFPSNPRKVKCIENGKIFRCANDACCWLMYEDKPGTCCTIERIKGACKDKLKTVYGYHWEFVDETTHI